MLKTAIASIVSACTEFSWLVLLAAAFLGVSASYYTVEHFAITTDTSKLISPNLPWRQREIQLDAAFPHQSDLIIAVIDGQTPELAEGAARKLESKLREDKVRFQRITRPGGGDFFDNNGLLFLTTQDVAHTSEELIRSQPFLGTLAADPTLRGLATALAYIPRGIAAGATSAQDFSAQLAAIASQIESILEGHAPWFSWGQVFTGERPAPSDLRRFVNIKPALDFGALEPGAEATDKIRAIVRELGLTPEKGVRVRLTGPVPMADEEFATVADGALVNTLATLAAVIFLLWAALKSPKIMLAVLISLFVGLALTAAAGLAMVGTLNLISVAFAVLFVGIGVDFGIQYSVRYREERHKIPDLKQALASAGREAGIPLVLAAAATAAGFYAFLPTDYKGVSELGLIAGTGMLIAFATSITLLPALLTIFNPRGEAAEVGYRWLAPVDRFLARYRYPILGVTLLSVAAGLPLLTALRFDFNPLNLRSQTTESVAATLDLLQDTANTPNTINILAPNLDAAGVLAKKLENLRQVSRVTTLASFVPDAQDEKLKLIADAANLLGPTLNPPDLAPQPSISETIETLLGTAQAFDAIPDDSAKRLGRALTALAKAEPERRAAAETAMMSSFKLRLAQIRSSLQAQAVILDRLPPDLVADWIAKDGRARIDVAPAGDANDADTLQLFANSVLSVAPDATGTPILIQESARTVVRAFLQAGALALLSITVILFIVLGRVSDVLMTLIPLLLAGVVTLELTVLLGVPFNFANIIALPLILGVGVAFKIYYVLAWRGGETSLLASSLTRAVFFSAMTTATAFGSLWFSHHPGTSSMGKLLSLSLVTTLAAAVLFQPILMGPPREKGESRQ